MLSFKEVQKNFNISQKKLYEMAKYLNIPKGKYGKYLFPDDFKPVYIPDGREYKNLKNSQALPYVYVMDVISKLWLAKDNYMGIDDQIRKTVVRELKKNKLIILKNDADKSSLDYTDYMVSLNVNNWMERKTKDREQFILNVITAVATGVTYGAAQALS